MKDEKEVGMSKKTSEIRKRFISTLPYLLSFLVVVLGLHFFG